MTNEAQGSSCGGLLGLVSAEGRRGSPVCPEGVERAQFVEVINS